MSQKLVHRAHHAGQRIAVGLKAGAALEGLVVAVDPDGFDVDGGRLETRIRWDDVWWVFPVKSAA